MYRIEVFRTIGAPIGIVFKTVSDISEFSKALPHVDKFEFLSDVHVGVGTRFRETRLMNGNEAITELEVTEYVKNEHVRMVANSHGAIWDTTYILTEKGDQTALTMLMDTNSYKFFARVMNYFIKGMVKKAVESDMDLVKAYCEDQNSHHTEIG